MQKKLRVGIIGATGMVGQRFITLLDNHPYFDISVLAASASSSGKLYKDAVSGRWKIDQPIPPCVENMTVINAADIQKVKDNADFVFCAVEMPKEEIKRLEEAYAKAELPVVSNNSANRWTEDVPMVIPEINAEHFEVINAQRKRLGTKKGFIVTKPNCSIQSYVPTLVPLLEYGIKAVSVSTYQAISGAGKTFDTFPEILDNVIPFISGEEEKSEKEPLKILGSVIGDRIVTANAPIISAQCIRISASDGHLATVSVSFEKKPSKDAILKAWSDYKGEPQLLGLPHAPEQFITYFEDNNRPQTAMDRNIYGGMGITAGRLRDDNIFDYKFVCLSHNTLRGAAGGAVLTAELLYKKGYFN